ncbi:hypothetical protein V1512DRAFT_268194 [Lipomyces arxii]|uniref:uncharacterized protein n=1 Tax=Lipomyces arxii TaxID=56418 RepID=UPI0034CD73DB
MKTFRIAIRQQLAALVCICVLLSLGVLAIVLAVVTQNYVLGLRAERLELVAKLKAAQIREAITFYRSQALSISTRDTIQRALGRYNVGNHTAQNWESSTSSFQVSLNSQDTLISATIYSLDFVSLLTATNNYTETSVVADLPAQLYPLSLGYHPDKSLTDLNGIFMGPYGVENEIVLSITIPIYNATSGQLNEIAGYLTVVSDASQLASMVADRSVLSEPSQYSLIGAYPAIDINSTQFVYLVPPTYDTYLFGKVFNVDTYDAAERVLLHQESGSMIKTESATNKDVSTGYSPIDIGFSNWAILVEVRTSDVYHPINHLRNISLATVFSLAAFMCIITLPIAHFAVRPIVRLRAATEKTTAPPSYSEGESSYNVSNGGTGNSQDSFAHHRYEQSDETDEFKAPTFRIPGMVYQKPRPLIVDELSELTTTYNNMTKELRKQYENLEDRVRDRTKELEAAKVLAECANEAKSVFIANITHELRTPLNGILGMTAISMSEQDPRRVQKNLGIIYKSGELLLHLLTDLLIFSRNQLGKMTVDENEFKMSEIANQIRAIFLKQAMSVKVGLSLDLMPQKIETMVLLGDSNRMLQIIINLISNGLKFTPEGGSIQVRIICLGSVDLVTDGRIESITTSRRDVRDVSEHKSQNAYNEKYGYGGKKAESVDLVETEKTGSRVSLNTKSASQSIRSKEQRSLSDTSFDNEEQGFGEHAKFSVPAIIRSQTPRLTTADIQRQNSAISKTGGIPLISPSISFTSRWRQKTSHNRYSTPESGSRLTAQSARSASPHSRPAQPKPMTDCFQEGQYLLFEFQVEDNGPGIPEHLHQRIFEPFVQGDQALSRKYGGAGLGLSICKQLAEMMNGSIEVESVEGLGSTFTLRVRLRYLKDVALSVVEDIPELEISDGSAVEPECPSPRGGALSQLGASSFFLNKSTTQPMNVITTYDDTDTISSMHSSIRSIAASLKVLMSSADGSNTSGSTNTPLSRDELPPPTRKIQILVVEDNRVNQQVVLRMLALESIASVVIAKDGNEAVEKVKSHCVDGKYFDIIFMDIQMPNLDGLQATRIIRQEYYYKHPIVALTAYADDSNVKECMDAGMNNFLTKPIKRSQLCEILDEYCDSRERNKSED